jgi:hypothetical protein
MDRSPFSFAQLRQRRSLLVFTALALVLLIGGLAWWTLSPRGGDKPAGTNITATGSPTTDTVLLTDIEPAEGAVIRGTDAWIRWGSPLFTEGRVHWREVGKGEYQTADATRGDTFLVRLQGLKPGTKYEYVVEGSAEGQVERSGPRTFTAEGGVTFEPGTVEQTVKRDYDQTVTLTLRNSSADKVTVAAKALAQFNDLPADIVGPGSADEPADVPSGGTLQLRLAVTAPDATKESYDIPVEAAGASAVARVRVAETQFKLRLNVLVEDPRTLAKTVELVNEGDDLTDLGIGMAPPNEAEVRLHPGAVHAFLPAGGKMQFVASPVLYLEFESLTAEIEAKAAGKSTRFRLEFKAPEGQDLMGVRTGSQRRGSNSDWYCTNRPDSCSNVPGPEGNGPAPGSGIGVARPSPNDDGPVPILASLVDAPPAGLAGGPTSQQGTGDVAFPSPGSCTGCDVPGACDHIAELLGLIDSYNDPNVATNNPARSGPGSFRRFTSEFDPLLGQLSNKDLACRFDQGSNMPPDVTTLLGQIHRARMNFKTLNSGSEFPTVSKCSNKITGNPMRAGEAEQCADYEAIKGPVNLGHPPALDEQGIYGALLKLAGLLGCPTKSSGGKPAPTPCPGGSEPPSDGAKEAADQVKGGLEEAWKLLDEERKKETSRLPGPNPQLDLINQRMKQIEKMIGFYGQIKAASCVPGDVLQSLEALRQRREGSCEEVCVAMYEWMVKMGAASSNARSLLIPACSRACDTATSR